MRQRQQRRSSAKAQHLAPVGPQQVDFGDSAYSAASGGRRSERTRGAHADGREPRTTAAGHRHVSRSATSTDSPFGPHALRPDRDRRPQDEARPSPAPRHQTGPLTHGPETAHRRRSLPRCARPAWIVRPSIGFFGALALGTTRHAEAQLGRLLQPLLAARRGPHLAGQADFAERHEAARQRPCRAGCTGSPASPPGRPPAR